MKKSAKTNIIEYAAFIATLIVAVAAFIKLTKTHDFGSCVPILILCTIVLYAIPRLAARAMQNEACKGDANAQFDIGMRYLHGNFGKRMDVGMAIYWLKLAAMQGHKNAIKNIKKRGLCSTDPEFLEICKGKN